MENEREGKKMNINVFFKYIYILYKYIYTAMLKNVQGLSKKEK